jgi:hypothetical protein
MWGAEQVERSRRRPWVQVASAALGVAILALSLIETLFPSGVGSLLPRAAGLAAGHWTVGIVLVVAAFGGGMTARVMVLVAGLALFATGFGALVGGHWLGGALGLAGDVPVMAGVLHVALGLLAVGASLLPSPTVA